MPMIVDSTAKFAALAIGVYLIVEAALGVSYQLTNAEEISRYQIATAGTTILISVLLAWILWRYASRTVWETQASNSIDLLRVGIKILAAYLLATGIPALLGSAAGTMFAVLVTEVESTQYIASLIASSVKTLFGMALIRRTDYFIEKLSGGI